MEFADEIVKSRYNPDRVKEEFFIFGRDSTALLKGLPRQIKQFARKIGHPDFAFRLSLVELEELKRSVETSSNIVFLGLIIGSLILSASITMFIERGPFLFHLPLVSAIGYILAGVLGLVAFYNYIRK